MTAAIRMLVFAGCLLQAARAPAAPLSDLVPEEAAGALVLRSVSDAGGKIDRLFKDNGFALPGNVPPSAFLRAILDQFKLAKGVDEKSPAAIVWPDAEKAGGPPTDDGNLVLAVPFTTLEEIGANFGLLGRLLKAGATRQIGQSHMHVRGRHLLLSQNGKALASVIESVPVTGRLDAERKAALEKADMYLHFRPEGMGAGWKAVLSELETAVKRDSDPASRAAGESFVETLADLRFVGAAVTLDGGLTVSAQAVFRKADGRGPPFARALGLATDSAPSSLAGLPLLHPLGAVALRLNAPDNAAAIRGQLRTWLDTEPAAKQNSAAGDRLVAAVERLFARTGAVRLSVFQTANAAEAEQIGLLGAVAIVDVDSTDGWRADVASAVEAFNKLFGPVFVHASGAETIAGARVDTVKMELGDGAGEKLKPLLGARWNTVRLAPHGKSVVVLIGSDAQTLGQTLEDLRAGGKGLAGHKAVSAAASRLDPRRKAEAHVCLKSLIAFLNALDAGKAPGGAAPVEAVTSLSISAEKDRVQIELRAPNVEIRAVVDAIKPLRALLIPANR